MVMIAAEVLAELARATVTGRQVTLPQIGDKATYTATCRALKDAGGQRIPGGYQFKIDAAIVINDLTVTGEVQVAADTGFYQTPELVVHRLFNAATGGTEIPDRADFTGMRILEPSAGRGRIAGPAAGRGGIVDCIDIDPAHCRHLETQGCYRLVRCVDFLNVQPSPVYDFVLMNPPWRRGVEAAHVLHAWQFLAPGGILAAVVPNTLASRTDRQSKAVRLALLELAHGQFTQLPPKSFAESGLNVDAAIITARRVAAPAPRRPTVPLPRADACQAEGLF